MIIRVLGSAAGGGFPQWNCNCSNCGRYRKAQITAQARTQSSIAVSSNRVDWLLVNASPDLLTQLKATPQLQPGRRTRDTGIKAVLLVDSQIDHTLGLAMLREGERLVLYCTSGVYEDLTTGNPLIRILDHYCGVEWREVHLGARFRIEGMDGIEFEAVPVASKAPPYSPHRANPQIGDNIGLMATDLASRYQVFYAPGLGEIEPLVWDKMRAADCVLVDGTFWTDDEMIVRGVGRKRACEMGHIAQSGEGGMLDFLQRLPETRKVLIHINNTNPILDEDSCERRALDEAGIEVAYDGMEIVIGAKLE